MEEADEDKQVNPSPSWTPVYQRLKNINKYAERFFSTPFRILETVLDNIHSFVTQHAVSYSFCMCITITATVSATAIAVGVGTGVGIGCSNTNGNSSNSTSS